MITDSKFEAGLRLLESHYNKSLSSDAISIWREYLDQELDDEQFTTAIKEAILSCEFFPTPKKLVEMATKSLEVKAMEEWSQVVKWSGYSIENQRKVMPQFSVRCRIALQIVGGFGVVGFAEAYELGRLEKKFVIAYCQCSPNSKALPPAAIPPITFEAEPEPKWGTFGTSNSSIKKILYTIGKKISGDELTEQQTALNMFVNKWGWHIDEGRLNHYLAMSQTSKALFVRRFGHFVKFKPDCKVIHFDNITGYKQPPPDASLRAIAKEWLKEEMN